MVSDGQADYGQRGLVVLGDGQADSGQRGLVAIGDGQVDSGQRGLVITGDGQADSGHKMVSIIDLYERDTHSSDLFRYGTGKGTFTLATNKRSAGARCGTKLCISQVGRPFQLVSTREAYRTALPMYTGMYSLF